MGSIRLFVPSDVTTNNGYAGIYVIEPKPISIKRSNWSSRRPGLIEADVNRQAACKQASANKHLIFGQPFNGILFAEKSHRGCLNVVAFAENRQRTDAA